jgi:hypothetical protein
MPSFSYSLTRGNETKLTVLRKSNPQGWLIDAVRATFPDVAARRGNDIIRLRLEKTEGAENWLATLADEPSDLVIRVSRTR